MLNHLIRLSHALSKYVVGAEGNVSVRLSPESFAVKASGTSLATLTEDDLVVCDNQGNKTDTSSKRPSIETGFHAWLLQQQDIAFVAHTHPVNTLKILCSSEHISSFATRRLFPDQVVFNGSVSCVVPYGNPGDDLLQKIKNCVEAYKVEHDCMPQLILLQNHGIITLGKTSSECCIATDICEKAAETYIGASILGSVSYISEENVAKIKSDKNEIYRKTLTR